MRILRQIVKDWLFLKTDILRFRASTRSSSGPKPTLISSQNPKPWRIESEFSVANYEGLSPWENWKCLNHFVPWVLWSLKRVVFLGAEIISSDEGNPPLLLTHCNKTRDNGFPRCFFSSVHAATACFTGNAYANEKLGNLLAAAAAIVITIATSSDIQYGGINISSWMC